MSIQSEINRISGNVSDALDAIEAKGVTIPSGSNSDDLATLIGQIQGGGGVDPDKLAIMVPPSSATGSAVTGEAVTEAPNYIPGGDITAPELDYEFKDNKLYIYGIKRPLFIGSGVKLVISSLTSNVVGVGAADYMRI